MRQKLQEWVNEQLVGDEMIWKGAFGSQISFVRRLTGLMATGLSYKAMDDITHVIATHRSKSITLPVYELSRPDLGLRLILRDNFHNWKLSVISERPIDADFSGLFHTTPPVEPAYTGEPLSSVYFEGFPGDLIFGYYNDQQGGTRQKWSAEIYGDHSLYTVVRV